MDKGQDCLTFSSLMKNSEYNHTAQEQGDILVDLRANATQSYRDFASLSFEHVDIFYPSLQERKRQQDSSLQQLLNFPKRKTFPNILHEILTLTDHLTYAFTSEDLVSIQLQDILCWDYHGRSFLIKDKQKLVSILFPTFFPHQNEYASFQRQLNLYGFKCLSGRKSVMTDTSEQKVKTFELYNQSLSTQHVRYYHELFIRARSDLCQYIHRRGKNDIPVNRHRPEPPNIPDFDKYPALLHPKMLQASTDTNSNMYDRASNNSVDSIMCQNCNDFVPDNQAKMKMNSNSFCLNNQNPLSSMSSLRSDHFDHNINTEKYPSVTQPTVSHTILSDLHDFNITSSKNYQIIDENKDSTILGDCVPKFTQYPQVCVQDINQVESSWPCILRTEQEEIDMLESFDYEIELATKFIHTPIPQSPSYQTIYTLSEVLNTSNKNVQNQAIANEFHPIKSYVLESSEFQKYPESSWIKYSEVDMDVFDFSDHLSCTKKRKREEDLSSMLALASNQENESPEQKMSCLNNPDTIRTNKAEDFENRRDLKIKYKPKYTILTSQNFFKSNQERIKIEADKADTLNATESCSTTGKSVMLQNKLHRNESISNYFKDLSRQQQSDIVTFFSEFRFDGHYLIID